MITLTGVNVGDVNNFTAGPLDGFSIVKAIATAMRP